MYAIVDKFISKRKFSKEKETILGILDSSTETIYYCRKTYLIQECEELIKNNQLVIKGLTRTSSGIYRCSVQKIEGIEYISSSRNSNSNYLCLSYPFNVNIDNVKDEPLGIECKTKKLNHYIQRTITYKNSIYKEFFYYPSLIPKTNTDLNRPYLYMHNALYTRSVNVENFTISDYINDVNFLCSKYNIKCIYNFPKYNDKILDLTELNLPTVCNYFTYLTDVKSKIVIFGKVDLSNLFCIRFLLNAYPDLEIVDFSNCYNDLDIIYQTDLFEFLKEPRVGNTVCNNLVVLLPNAPKFIKVMEKVNKLKFMGYCNKENRLQEAQKIRAKNILANKSLPHMYLIVK